MRKLLYATFIALGCSISPNIEAQDHHFSQVLMTPQLTNPATTGMFRGGYRVYLNYRSQWVPLGSPYTTYAGAFDTKLFKKKKDGGYIGFGLNAFKDAAGDGNFGLLQVNMNVSGVMPIGSNHWASAGLAVGGGQHSVSMASLTWGTQFNGSTFDPALASGESETLNSSIFFDIGAGVNYRYSNLTGKFVGEDLFEFDIGAAYFHVNKPQTYFVTSSPEGLYGKMVIRGKLRKDFRGTNVGIVPFGQYISQGPHKKIDIGTLLRFKLKSASKRTDFFAETSLSVGLQYRLSQALVPQMYLEFSGWTVGFAYDYNMSPLAEIGSANGGFEVSIKYINFNEPRITGKSRGRGGRL